MNLAALYCRICREWVPPALPSEEAYQESLGAFLEGIGVPHVREVRLTDTDRVDFMVGSIAIELKVKCSAADLLRQLQRYAQSQQVEEILALSFTRNCLRMLPGSLSGKPVMSYCFGRSF
jgi:antitoxin component of MazEF toxin-antitoxin module